MTNTRPIRSRVLVLVAALCVATAGPLSAFDNPEDMPEGEGREDAFYTCAGCHSMQVVVRQGMSPAMWDDTLTLMVERHGMQPLPDDERALILEYLSENFPATASTGTSRGWVNPFAP